MIQFSEHIKEKALALGFSLCGISRIRVLEQENQTLTKWLADGKHGQMSYLERNSDKRQNPALLLEGAQSIISVVLNYFPQKQLSKSPYILSKYAYGTDYHFVVKDKLQQLEDFILAQYPATRFRRFVDSAPVFDKVWAVEAGLGWIGKNTMLINPRHGSFFFVGELITTLALESDNAFETAHCGTCTRCMDACPTGAIEAPYQLNATKCISYHTIEVKDDIPEALAKKFQGRLFGCDICQDVCPWNKKAKAHNEQAFVPSEALVNMGKEDWENLSKEDFNKLFKNSPLKRAGYDKVMRNIASLRPYIEENT